MKKQKTIPKNLLNLVFFAFLFITFLPSQAQLTLPVIELLGEDTQVKWLTDGGVSVNTPSGGGGVRLVSAINLSDASINNGMVKMRVTDFSGTLRSQLVRSNISMWGGSYLGTELNVTINVYDYRKENGIDYTKNFLLYSFTNNGGNVTINPVSTELKTSGNSIIQSDYTNRIRQAIQKMRIYSANGIQLNSIFSSSLANIQEWPAPQSVIVEMIIKNGTISSLNLPGISPIIPLEVYSCLSVQVNGQIRGLDKLNDLQIGDQVKFTVRAPSPSQIKISGLPGIWTARVAGEVLYYCTPSITPGEYRPFLGFDSQVHGTAVRKYPDGFKLKEDDWVSNNDGTYSFTYTVQRPMDPSISHGVVVDGENIVKWKKTKPSNTKLPGGGTATEQRNNQREGLNMNLLQAWWGEDWNGTNPSSLENAFVNEYTSVQDREKYILGTDDDEFLFINSPYYNTQASTVDPSITAHNPDAILQDDFNMWRIVPQGESTNSVNDMVSAYQKNRTWVNGGNVNQLTPYSGYEIQDKDNFFKGTIVKDGEKVRDGVYTPNTDSTPCDGVGCFRIATGPSYDKKKTPTSSGNITVTCPESQYNIQLTASPKLGGGFYANIIGTQWPAILEETSYTLASLGMLSNEELSQLKFVYEYEDHLGILYSDVRQLDPSRYNEVRTTGKWTEKFKIGNWGYHNLTAYYKDIPIAGKELLEIAMRFLSVPGTGGGENGPTYQPSGIALNEGRGEGAYWFLEEFNTTSPYLIPVYGHDDNHFVREYVFKKGTNVTFAANDADPLTFWSYTKDFYLSERTQAMRVPNDTLKKYMKWTLTPVYYWGYKDKSSYSYGPPKELSSVDGRLCSYQYQETGYFELKATYRSQSLSHLIKIVDYGYNKVVGATKGSPEELELNSAVKGKISLYDLSPDEAKWLGYPTDAPYVVASVEDVMSHWKFKDGPRMPKELRADERFEKYSNYHDVYLWYSNNTLIQRLEKVNSFINNYENIRITWFPKNWMRHQGTKDAPLSDVDASKITKAHIASFNPLADKIAPIFQGVPEPWQFRASWTSYTVDGYRTRTNIKAIYDLEKFFDNNNGAFAGKGNTNPKYANNLAAYYKDTENTIPTLTDEQKAQYQFYLDLKSGRKVIINKNDFLDLVVTNQNPEDKTGLIEKQFFIARLRNRTVSALPKFLMGMDMSDYSAMKANGDKWYYEGKNLTTTEITDPYQFLTSSNFVGENKPNVVRLHLWADPVYELPGNPKNGQNYPYNTLADVRDQIIQAKAAGLQVILDVMYSDTWCNPQQQIVPKRFIPIENRNDPNWAARTTNWDHLAISMFTYTTEVLTELWNAGATPDYITIGNETSVNILAPKGINGYEIEPNDSNQKLVDQSSPTFDLYGPTDSSKRVGYVLTKEDLYRVNWDRQAMLFNAALLAVRSFNNQKSLTPVNRIKTMLHFPQLNDISWHLTQATQRITSQKNGTGTIDLSLVDAIGTSYYAMYSDKRFKTSDVKYYIEQIKDEFGLDVVILETAYPFTWNDFDQGKNILSREYPLNLWDKYYDSTKPNNLRDIEEAEQNQNLQELVGVVRSARGGKGVLLFAPFQKGTTTTFNNFVGSVNDNLCVFKTDPDSKDGLLNEKSAIKIFGYRDNANPNNQIIDSKAQLKGVNYTVAQIAVNATFGKGDINDFKDQWVITDVNFGAGAYFTPIYRSNLNQGAQFLRISGLGNECTFISSISDSQSPQLAKIFNLYNSTRTISRSSDYVFKAKKPDGNTVAYYAWTLKDHVNLPSDYGVLIDDVGAITAEGPFFASLTKPEITRPVAPATLTNNKKPLTASGLGGHTVQFPENSIDAFKESTIGLSASAIEVGVALTKDHVLILSSDGYSLRENDLGYAGQLDITQYINFLANTPKNEWVTKAPSFVQNPLLQLSPINEVSWQTSATDPLRDSKLRDRSGLRSAYGILKFENLLGSLNSPSNKKIYMVHNALQNGSAYKTYAVALKNLDEDNTVFKFNGAIDVDELEKMYGREFMQQIMLIPIYEDGNTNPYPWASYLSLQEQIKTNNWTVPGYQLEIRNSNSPLPPTKQMLQILNQEKGRKRIAVSNRIPFNCTYYKTSWLNDNCTFTSDDCPAIDRRMDMNYLLNLGYDYFISDDLNYTRDFLAKTKLGNQ